MSFPITFALIESERTIVRAFGHIASGAHVIGITSAGAVHTNTMTRTINGRIDGRTAVYLVRYIEAGHVVRIVTEKMQ